MAQPCRDEPSSVSDQLRFTAFTDDDLPELEAMALDLHAEDVGSEPMSAVKVRRTVRELTCRPDKGRILLFRIAGDVVGYAIVIHFWSNEYGGDILDVDELFVKPAWRGRGIGAGFIRHLAGSAGDSVVGLQLEVSPRNTRAAGFYRREGFAPAPNHVLFRRL